MMDSPPPFLLLALGSKESRLSPCLCAGGVWRLFPSTGPFGQSRRRSSWPSSLAHVGCISAAWFRLGAPQAAGSEMQALRSTIPQPDHGSVALAEGRQLMFWPHPLIAELCH